MSQPLHQTLLGQIANEVLLIRGIQLQVRRPRGILSNHYSCMPFTWIQNSGKLETVDCHQSLTCMAVCFLAMGLGVISNSGGSVLHLVDGFMYLFVGYATFYQKVSCRVTALYFNQVLQVLGLKVGNKSNGLELDNIIKGGDLRLKIILLYCKLIRISFEKVHFVHAAAAILKFNQFGLFHRLVGFENLSTGFQIAGLITEFCFLCICWWLVLPLFHFVVVGNLLFPIIGLTEVISSLELLSPHDQTSSFREIQVLAILLNEFLQAVGFINVEILILVSLSTAGLYCAVSGSSKFLRLVFLFLSVGCFSFLFLLSRFASSVYTTSLKVITDIWNRKETGIMQLIETKKENRHFAKHCKSWTPVKVKLFSSNFFDQKSPLNFSDFCVENAATLLLL